jgi:hypothetical protein
MPNHYAGDLLHTVAISGLSRVRTELFELTVVPALAPHPVQMHGKFAGHGYLRDLPSPPHREVKELTAPLHLAAYRHLRRFHQQKTEFTDAASILIFASPALTTGSGTFSTLRFSRLLLNAVM